MALVKVTRLDPHRRDDALCEVWINTDHVLEMDRVSTKEGAWTSIRLDYIDELSDWVPEEGQTWADEPMANYYIRESPELIAAACA